MTATKMTLTMMTVAVQRRRLFLDILLALFLVPSAPLFSKQIFTVASSEYGIYLKTFSLFIVLGRA